MSALLLISAGCAPAGKPYLTVQICVGNARGVSLFLGETKAIAEARGLRYVDRSAESQQELTELKYEGVEQSHGHQTINISALKSDGLGFGATNIGLKERQILIGFSEGGNRSDSRNFANNVIERFGRHWKVELISQETGATPMADCD